MMAIKIENWCKFATFYLFWGLIFIINKHVFAGPNNSKPVLSFPKQLMENLVRNIYDSPSQEEATSALEEIFKKAYRENKEEKNDVEKHRCALHNVYSRFMEHDFPHKNKYFPNEQEIVKTKLVVAYLIVEKIISIKNKCNISSIKLEAVNIAVGMISKLGVAEHMLNTLFAMLHEEKEIRAILENLKESFISACSNNGHSEEIGNFIDLILKYDLEGDMKKDKDCGIEIYLAYFIFEGLNEAAKARQFKTVNAIVENVIDSKNFSSKFKFMVIRNVLYIGLNSAITIIEKNEYARNIITRIVGKLDYEHELELLKARFKAVDGSSYQNSLPDENHASLGCEIFLDYAENKSLKDTKLSIKDLKNGIYKLDVLNYTQIYYNKIKEIKLRDNSYEKNFLNKNQINLGWDKVDERFIDVIHDKDSIFINLSKQLNPKDFDELVINYVQLVLNGEIDRNVFLQEFLKDIKWLENHNSSSYDPYHNKSTEELVDIIDKSNLFDKEKNMIKEKISGLKSNSDIKPYNGDYDEGN